MKKEHHEDGFGKFCFSSRQETYAESTQRGDAHEKMLVEDIPVDDSLNGFFECGAADEEVGDEIDKQKLPCGELAVMFHPHGSSEQHGCGNNEQQLSLLATVVMMAAALDVLTVVMMVMSL